MKKIKYVFYFAALLVSYVSCSSDDPAADPELEVVKTEFAFGEEASKQPLTIQTNVDWNLSSSASWCTLSKTSGKAGTVQVEISVTANTALFKRTGTITVRTASHTETIAINQAGLTHAIAANNAGMSSNAITLAKKIHLGWNLGNTLEAMSKVNGVYVGSETVWGNAKATEAFIKAVKAAGFNAIRIPCAWDVYVEDRNTYKIKDSWMTRVKEVVNYCVNNDMYAILNVHWDGGWLENNPTYAKQTVVNQEQEALWKQIAVAFRDYDEHLLFAGTNEVHVDYNTPSKENIAVQWSFNQTFVDAVRATGGRNAYRNLVVQTYNTNIALGVSDMKIPTDPATNRLMVEVHYYDPYDFVLNDEKENPGTGKYFWGEPYKSYGIDNWGQEDYMKQQLANVKKAFVDKGYPVILGEFGAIRRLSLTGNILQKHLESRAYYAKTLVATAKQNGLLPFYWDPGYTGDLSSGIFNRTTGEAVDKLVLDALVTAAAENNYPF